MLATFITNFQTAIKSIFPFLKIVTHFALYLQLISSTLVKPKRN